MKEKKAILWHCSGLSSIFGSVIFLTVDIVILVLSFIIKILLHENSFSIMATILLIAAFYNAICLPVGLLIWNILENIKRKKYFFIMKIVLIVLTITLGIILQYFAWVVSGGDLIEPDWLTIGFYTLELQLSLIITLVVGLIVQIIFFLNYNKGKNKVI